MRVALDAMGGDFAPQPNIDGAIAAVQADTDLHVVLVGDESRIRSLLDDSGYCGERISICAAQDVVGMEEKPTVAMRKKPNSSIAVCWRMMAAKEVDAVVSAGNTGAVVAFGLRTRLFLKGVKRPGIAVALPNITGHSVLVDVGANPAARPEHLVQYAIMGNIYSREILGVNSPRIGLINIGREEGKGNELYRLTHESLSQSRFKDQYIGNVEGRGLYLGEADVLVCEGFVGNVVLKTSEGMAEFLLKTIGIAMAEQLNAERDIAKNVLQKLARQYHYAEAGGAPLLGIDGICIICHGSSDARSIGNAFHVAATFQHRQINARIVEKLAEQNGA